MNDSQGSAAARLTGRIWPSIRRWVDWWIPRQIREVGGREQHTARLLISMMLLGCLLALCAAIGHGLIGSPVLAKIAGSVFVLELVLLTSVRLTGRLQLFIQLSLLLMSLPILLIGYQNGGWASVEYRWVTAIPLVATFLGGRRDGIRWTGVGLFVTLVLFGLDSAGWPFPNPIPAEQKSGAQFISLTFLLVFTLGIAFLFDEMKDFAVAEVEKVNLALEHEVAERKQAEEELVNVHEQLVLASRESGMAEVATGILHNMGNVLTTLNTSAAMIAERTHPSGIEGLRKAAEMLEANRGDLARFFSTESVGMRFPEYFRVLAESLRREREELSVQVADLRRSIHHINMIIDLQQTYARGSNFHEWVRLPDLIEEATRIVVMSGKEDVGVATEIEELLLVSTDRHQVLQILVTLVRNAMDAVRERRLMHPEIEQPEWGVCISLGRAGEDEAVIEVRDEGVGILEEDMTRIFSFGFTTKKQGHGFGLHNAALVATELRGSVGVFSKGCELGATFSLTLPIDREAANHGRDGRSPG